MKILTNKTIGSFLSKLTLDSIPVQEKVEKIQFVIQFIDWLVETDELSAGDAIRFRNELYKKKRELSHKQAPKLPLPLKYVGFSLGILSLLLVVGGIYIRFFRTTRTPFAYSTAPVQAGRTISFQGRLTDSLGNPINAPIDITYNFYTAPTGGTPITGSTRVCTAGPDQDGVFSSLIGNDSGPSCNTELPNSIFTENPTVYLGVTVGTEPSEMTPRQQIANVGYAINSETLQGMPPGQSVSNIPFINQDGNMLIGASNPGIRSTYASSNFTISSAQATTIQSAGSGDITLSASEGGSLRFKAYNGTLEEVMTILNTGRVGIGITAPRALLDVNGDATVSGSLIAGGQIKVGEFTSPPTNLGNGSLYYDSNTNKIYFWNGTSWADMGSGTTQYFQRTLGSLAPTNITDDLNLGAVATGSAIVHLPGTNNQNAWFNLGTGKVGIGTNNPNFLLSMGNALGDKISLYDSGTGNTYGLGIQSALMQLYTVDSASDITFGYGNSSTMTRNVTFKGTGNVGIGTPSPAAKLDVNGNLNVNTYATVGASLALGTSNAAAGPGNLSMSGNLLTAGNVTFSSLATGIVRSISGVLSSSAINLASGDVTGLLSSTNGGTGADNSSAAQYSVPYYSSTGVLGGILTPGSVGYVLSTNGAGGAPTWINASGVGTNYWEIANGAVYPVNATLDAFIGGAASASAKFAFLNVNSGTPTASISGTTANVNTFIDGNGNIGTTNRTSLVLGNSTAYDSTGNILLNPNGTGNVGIGTSNPGSPLEIFQSGTNGLRFSRNSHETIEIAQLGADRLSFVNRNDGIEYITLYDNGFVGIGDIAPSQKLDVAGNATVSGDLMAGGQLQIGRFDYEPSAVGVGSFYFNTTDNTPYYHNGTSWTAFSAGGANYWNIANGAIYPINSTLDMFIGGTASASAKFAFLNVDGGTPTASVAGSLADVATYLTGDGNLATTNMAALTVGGASTGSIQLSPKGTTGLFVDGSGNVGVGTINPNGKLHTQSASAGGGTISADADEAIFENNTHGGITIKTPNTSIGALVFADQDSGYQGWLRYAHNVNALTLGTAATERLRIDASGNVGIGDTTPDHMLDVAGNIGLDASGYINWGDTDGTGGYGFRDNAGVLEFKNNAGSWNPFTGSTSLYWQRTLSSLAPQNITDDINIGAVATGGALVHLPGTNDQNAWFNLGTGNVGIGTITPATSLDVTGDNKALGVSQTSYSFGGGSQIIGAEIAAWDGTRTNAAGTYYTRWTGSATNYNNAYIGQENNSGWGLAFKTDSFASNIPSTSTRMFITASGNVGIGDITPAYLFTVGNGDLFQVDSSGNAKAPTLALGTYSIAPTDRVFTAGATTAMANTTTYTGVFSRTLTGTLTGNISNTTGLYSGLTINATDGMYSHAANSLQSSLSLSNGNTIDTMRGAYLSVSNNSSTLSPDTGATATTSAALHANADNSAAGIITNQYGGSFISYNNSTGSVTNARGTNSQAFNNNATGLITNAYGGYNNAYTNVDGASITTAYGTYGGVNELAAQTTGGITTGYGGYFVAQDANTSYGLFAEALHNTANTETFTNAFGIRNDCESNGANVTISNCYGIQSTITETLGTITNGYSGYFSSAATMNTGYGVYSNLTGASPTNYGLFSNVTGAGTTNYGLYTNVANAGTNYSIYTNGTARSFLGGNLGIVANGYLNFGTTDGSGGYGFRDNGGMIEFKNSAGSWTGIGTGGSGSSNWTIANGSIYPVNATLDAFIGGTASASAKFAFLNVNSGTPTASISGTTANVNMFIDGNGNIGTTNRKTLTLGNSASYNSTGNILLNPNGVGVVGIGTTNPGNYLLDINDDNAGGVGMRVTGGGSGGPLATFIRDVGSTGTISIHASGGDPQISFASAANTFSLGTNGTSFKIADNTSVGTNDYLTILNTGSVGIGTTSPLAALDIRKTSGTTPVASISGATSKSTLVVDQSGVGDIMTASSSGETRFVVNNNGNVGIGLTNPTYKLDVNGTVRGDIFTDTVGGGSYYVDPSGDSVFGGGLSLVGGFTASSASVSGNLTMGYGGQLRSAYGPLNLAYKSGLNAWTTGLILQDTTGNVGIGTIAPVANLHVFSATNAQMKLETGANANATFNIFEDGGANDHGASFSLDGTNNVVSWQSVLSGVGTNVLSIPYAGTYANRIGINTKTPLASLDLRSMLGTIPVASISGNTSQAALIVDQSGVGDIFTASSSGKTRFVIKSNGNVGIGVADPTGKLSIAGTSSTISNLSGDIVLDSASGNISFSNDNLINVANIASIGQIQLGGFASPPTSIGNGAMYYDTTNNKVFYWDGTIWSEMGSKYWQRTLGSLSPQYITDALNLGAIASGSALVHLPGTNNQDAWFNLGTGTVGIGTTTPDPGGYGYKLDVSGTMVADKYVDSASNSYYVDPAGDSVLGGNLTLGDIFMIDGTPLISSLNAGSYSTITIKGSGDTTTASLCVDEGTGSACDGKINAGTIDPPYTINGKKYATYLPSMTGVKEETTGKVLLTERNEEAKAYIKRIALGNQPEDSDLWLFAKATNLKDQIQDMTVLLSSNTSGKTWYSVDPATMVLTFYSSTPSEISYRLTAPRFDAGRWANTRHESDFGTGFILNDRGNILAGAAPTYTAPKIVSQGSIFTLVGNFIEEFTAANQALFANLTAGLVTTQKIVSPLAEIDTLNVNNKIQSKEIDTELLKASNSIQTPRINTNAIDIGTQSGQLAQLVINGLHNTPVVTIDAEGSATFAGTLTADMIQTQSASISGTLVAKEIQSETIDALSTQLASNSSTLASSYQTLSGDINAVQQELAALKTAPLPNASYYQNLDATYNSLSITDTANIYKAYVSDSLVVGSLFMEDHSILALASDLSISSLGTITFFDGSVVMAKNGNITSKGEISASSLAIKNQAGVTVAEIDASGSARFNEIVAKKFSLESIATQGALIADSGIVNDVNVPISAIKTNAEIAGVGTVPQDAKEVIIYNDNVTEDSLIYLTPTSDNAQGQLSVSKKVTCTQNSQLPCTPYFIVSSSLLIHAKTPFNWLIIN